MDSRSPFRAMDDPAREAGGGTGNGPRNLGERVAVLEERLKHVALREDVARIKVWVLGGVIAGIVIAVTLALTVARLFPPPAEGSFPASPARSSIPSWTDADR